MEMFESIAQVAADLACRKDAIPRVLNSLQQKLTTTLQELHKQNEKMAAWVTQHDGIKWWIEQLTFEAAILRAVMHELQRAHAKFDEAVNGNGHADEAVELGATPPATPEDSGCDPSIFDERWTTVDPPDVRERSERRQ